MLKMLVTEKNSSMTTTERSVEELKKEIREKVRAKVEAVQYTNMHVSWGEIESIVFEVVVQERQKRDEMVKAERERIKRHITEWDYHSRSDAEFAENVRHYFREIIT